MIEKIKIMDLSFRYNMTMTMIIIMKTKIKMITMIMMVIMKRVIGRAISNWLCAKRIRNSGNN